MAIHAESAEHRHAGGFWPFRFALAWIGLAMMLCLPGCGGCRKTTDADEQEKQQAEEKAKKKKEKEKPPFEAQKPVAMPSGKDFAGTCKPGHWISLVWPDVQANRGDFQGDLHTEVCDIRDQRAPLVAVPYEMANQRPAALAKEQPKSLESTTWIPPQQDAVTVNLKLDAGGGGMTAIQGTMFLHRMHSFQYFFIVLSKAPSRFDYLKTITSIHSRPSKADADAGPKFYEVVSMSGTRRPNLPSNALCWTSIAYLLWDDFDAAKLDIDQQQALIDWLHWGGQIIVSGPDALEQLRTSFLQPYLPASVEKSRSFAGEDLAELQYWAGKVGKPPRPVKPWPGAVLKKDPHDAKYLPYTGELLIERQVGRGRIVVSAFRLSGQDLTGWPGFDCFFNSCLLRRPARIFKGEPNPEGLKLHWIDGTASSPLDAAKMTAVRYFVRDTGVPFASYAKDIVAAHSAGENLGVGGSSARYGTFGNNPNPPPGDDASIEDEIASIPSDQDVAPGLAAWNDFSPVAQAARSALVDAAGIKVPERRFVIWVVIGYLCVLVPANWLVFRFLRRVEWAWIAAPLIAIGCTAVVIQQAQLNIGFARSRNEIAVVEMQSGYSRAHVARYTKLYTSLATRYEFRLDGPGGQILPFPRESAPEQFIMPIWQSRSELVCRRGDETQLTGFSVASNDADSIHSEEMADFGGTVTLHRDSDGVLRVTNGTAHPLDDCKIMRGTSGVAELATIDRLDPGATKPLSFDRPLPATTDRLPRGSDPSGELSAEGIIRVAMEQQKLRPDEVCLLARIVDEVPALTVTPESRHQQKRQAALLVAHLDAGQLPPPAADEEPSSSDAEPQGQPPSP